MKKRILPALAAILLVFFTAVSPAAAYSIDKPSPIYIGDYANVIDADTENYIAREAANLDDMCGAQIVIITVDFLNGEEIENVAYQIFNDWGIGNAERNNGVLLLMAIVDDDYWCMVGKGIEDDPLDETVLSYLLDEYLEPDFAARNYSDGALKFFDAVYDKLYDYYRGGVNPNPNPNPNPHPQPNPGPDTDETASKIATLILIVLIVLLVMALMRKSYARRNPGVYRTRPLQFWVPRAPRIYYRPGYRPTGNTYHPYNNYNTYPNGHQPSGNNGSGWGNNNHNNNSGSSSSSGHYGSGSFGGGSSYGGGVGRSSRSSGSSKGYSGHSYSSGSSSKSSFGSTHSSSSSSYSSGSHSSSSYSSSSSSSRSHSSSSHSSGGGGSSSGGGAGRHK